MELRETLLPTAATVADATAALEGALDAARHAQAGASGQGELLVRLAVPLAGDVAVQRALAWLPASGPRAFWAGRDGTLRLAARGEAWAVGGMGWTLEEGLGALEAGLADAPERLRLFGGVCFHGELRSEGPWKPFGAWRFALPRVELGVDGSGAWLAAHVHGSAETWASAVAATRQALLAPWRDEAGQRGFEAGEPSDVPTQDGWRTRVERALAEIDAGRFDKVVLARQRRIALSPRPDAADLLARLAAAEPESFRFLLQPEEDAAFFGASPERLLAVDGARVVSEALAGTRRRGQGEAEDDALAAELLDSAKDAREHAAVVEMVARTLQQVAVAVDVTPTPGVMRLARVQHLHTPIHARLDRPGGLARLLRALHPTPAVCGSPRQPAQRWLAEHEPFQRGLYAAPVGWIGGGWRAEFTVALRSALLEGHALSLFSGAGLVEGSEPEAEWREIDHKVAALQQALAGGAS